MKINAEKLSKWKSLVDERKQRKIKVDEFCKEKNITVPQFYYYHKRVNKNKTSKDKTSENPIIKPKSRIGCINKGFHFLGINYPGTQLQDKTKEAQVINGNAENPQYDANNLNHSGGVSDKYAQELHEKIVPHARTLRKAREQVKVMVDTGFSTHRIRAYLGKWALWWVITSNTWNREDLLQQLMMSCWDHKLAGFIGRLLSDITLSRTSSSERTGSAWL